MEKIIIVWRFKEGEKKARLRFRLREGRAVDAFHKSNIMATLSDLEKFEVNGELRPRVTIYNKDLYAAGLHRLGSKAVQRYTMLELKGRFALMCAAFGEEQYKVGEDFEYLQ